MDDQIMNFKEAMSFLKIPRSTLYKLVQEGRVPAMKVGRHWRFSRSTLEKWIAGNGSESSSISSINQSTESRDYCWQAVERKTGEDHDCTLCLAYKARAKNCFLLRREVGDELVQCTSPCRECEYYQQNFN